MIDCWGRGIGAIYASKVNPHPHRSRGHRISTIPWPGTTASPLNSNEQDKFCITLRVLFNKLILGALTLRPISSRGLPIGRYNRWGIRQPN
jgi:hypothetical protein